MFKKHLYQSYIYFFMAILNMKEMKYGVELNEIILKIGMIHGFEEICDVHEATLALVLFFIHAIIMHILLYKCIYTYYTLFLCLQVEEEAVESQRQVDQQNIVLNNSSTISPTGDEEIMHARNARNDNNSSDK